MEGAGAPACFVEGCDKVCSSASVLVSNLFRDSGPVLKPTSTEQRSIFSWGRGGGGIVTHASSGKGSKSRASTECWSFLFLSRCGEYSSEADEYRAMTVTEVTRGLAQRGHLGTLAGIVVIALIVKSVVWKNVILFDNIIWYQIIQYKWNKSLFSSNRNLAIYFFK